MNRSAGRTPGWLVSPVGQRPDYVLITDAVGVIRGIGRVSERCHFEAAGERCEWLGMIADFTASEHYAAYAIHTDTQTACRLGTGK